MITRADYGTGTLSTRYSTASPDEGLRLWFAAWGGHWGAAGTALGLVSLLCALKKENRATWGGPLLLLWVFTGPVFALLARLEAAELSVAILQPALAAPGLAAALAAGLSADYLRRANRVLGGAVFGLAAVTLAVKLAPAAPAQVQRGNLVAPDYARNLLRTLPPGSLLLMISDAAVFAVDHALHAEGRRPDLTAVVDSNLPWRWRLYRRLHPDIFSDGQQDGGAELVRVQAPRRAIYTEGMQAKFLDALCPRGLAAAVEWPRRTAACLDGLEESRALWNFYVRRPPSSEALAADYYSRAVLKTTSSGAYNGGFLLAEGGRADAARALYLRALFWSPERLLRWSERF